MAFEGADFVDYNEYDGKPTLLEFGGGAGELALALSDKFDVTYYDIPGVTSDYARHRSEVHYGSPIKICTELPDEKFDFISMQDVYEHVENPKALMKDVRERLKDGGLFISSALWFSTSHPLHINENAAGREAVGVYFGMNYKMWLTHTFESEGIQGEEAATTIGAFKHKPVLNDVLGEHLDIYLAKKVVYEPLPIPECLKHLDMMCKESYVMTIM
jgi:2-polyprenyl-3-methyl-5-hydroxy-6-metoxy-1,4-benzoquinol methylase